MPKAKVVVNRKGFGELMVSPEIEAALRPYADQVAARVPGSEIVAIRTGVGTGNARTRLRVQNTVSARADLVSAVRAVVGRAKEV
ncbi:hypothetical protein QP735_04340 [Curtobacterium citreum]|uniref:hypothetical protein n=1 Tax=Curtobacterium citreum TaxID=2036 RepID=UPI002550B5F5|nr:hypothetical protein [Curtobacterium citreum]MDK8171753.1 hypothetical protein [Curtobacterium citreum]